MASGGDSEGRKNQKGIWVTGRVEYIPPKPVWQQGGKRENSETEGYGMGVGLRNEGIWGGDVGAFSVLALTLARDLLSESRCMMRAGAPHPVHFPHLGYPRKQCPLQAKKKKGGGGGDEKGGGGGTHPAMQPPTKTTQTGGR